MERFRSWVKSLSLGGKIAIGAVSLVTASSLVGAASHTVPAVRNLTPVDNQVSHQPNVEVETVSETQPVHFTSQTIDDPTLPQGQSAVRAEGKDGIKTLVFEVTYTDGAETSRKQVSEAVSIPPITKVIANGTKVPAPTLSNSNTYTNVDGNTVHSPAYSSNGQAPAGATAQCGDGTYSFSQHASGTCSHHGGVAQWL